MRVIRVKQRFLDQIRSGTKTIEVRVGYSSIQTIQQGERIRFTSRDQSEIVVVNAVRQYASFDEMVSFEPVEQIAPDTSPAEVLPLLRRIYPPDRERLGVFVMDVAVESRA